MPLDEVKVAYGDINAYLKNQGFDTLTDNFGGYDVQQALTYFANFDATNGASSVIRAEFLRTTSEVRGWSTNQSVFQSPYQYEYYVHLRLIDMRSGSLPLARFYVDEPELITIRFVVECKG